MSRDVMQTAAVAAAVQRLAHALEDMQEELPGQLALAANPETLAAEAGAMLETLERQLRWLANDMARVRVAITARENSHATK